MSKIDEVMKAWQEDRKEVSWQDLQTIKAENEALRAQIGHGAPDGWQLVPKEPTDAMIRAALHLDLSYMPGHDGPDRAAVYKAMLASAPPAPKDAEKRPFTPDWANYRQGFQDGQASVVQQKPLTDEQIDNLYINGTKHWIGKREIARAIEAAHHIGEKK